jgi:peptidoglycan/xylan/chitin deacetylase (PgdA/CDA1 family)
MSEHSIAMRRWLAKKGARLGVASASLPLTLSKGHADRLRVLTYHCLVDEVRSPFSVAPAALERQMEWLSWHKLAVGTAFAAEVAAGRTANRRAVVVTMDDGDPSVIDNAAPIFELHGIPYAAYVIPGRIGQKNHMSNAQLRELSDRGAEIGSHTMTHRSVTSLTARELTDELVRSKQIIEDITGRAVTSFVYPFGTLRDFDQRAGEELRKVGYLIAFTSQHGPVVPGLDPMFLPRIKIEGGDPDWLFRAACSGAMDQWRFIDAGLSGLQKPAGGDLAGAATAGGRAA